MERILVTGSSGFTGRYLVPLLRNSGHEVHGISLSEGDKDDSCIDLLDATALENVLKRFCPTVVVHLGAVSFAGAGNAARLHDVNVVGSLNLAQAVLSNCPDLKKFIFASSATVYGGSESGQLSEDLPCNPLNQYAISKFSAELALSEMDLPLQVVRPFNYSGVGQSDQFVVPKIVNAFRAREERLELGNTNVRRDFSDVRDVINVYAELVEHPELHPKVLNICSGTGVSLKDIISWASEFTLHDLVIDVNETFLRKNDPEVIVGDTERLDRFSNVTFRSFKDTIAWMCSHDRS